MRLREKDKDIIIKCFKKYFLEADHLWLFGSRIDDTKKGGDIDLYIETYYDSVEDVTQSKKKFRIDLMTYLGEQKIDVVIKRIKSDTHLLIYDVAREEGVQLV